jgi:hypothetical protein
VGVEGTAEAVVADEGVAVVATEVEVAVGTAEIGVVAIAVTAGAEATGEAGGATATDPTFESAAGWLRRFLGSDSNSQV